MLKLNGGLGTSMGLDKAKSLLEVKGGAAFLDLTAKQVVSMRKKFQQPIKFMLMNSFSTSADTLAFLQKGYPGLASEEGLEMLQNKVPKLDATTYEVRIENGLEISRCLFFIISLGIWTTKACYLRKQPFK